MSITVHQTLVNGYKARGYKTNGFLAALRDEALLQRDY